jgi:hypothetical protein
MKAGEDAAPLEEAQATFIQGGVSVIVATRNDAMVADAMRGCGCRVSRDRRRVIVLVDRLRAESLVAHVTANGQVAVVFSQPSTHRTIQLKGSDASLVRPKPSDRAVVASHREEWVDELCRIGYAREFAKALWGPLPEALVAISFTPTAAFQQTPGPAAGQPLPRSA